VTVSLGNSTTVIVVIVVDALGALVVDFSSRVNVEPNSELKLSRLFSPSVLAVASVVTFSLVPPASVVLDVPSLPVAVESPSKFDTTASSTGASPAPVASSAWAPASSSLAAAATSSASATFHSIGNFDALFRNIIT